MRMNTFLCVTGVILLSIAGSLGQLDVCGVAPANSGTNATEGVWPWNAILHSVSMEYDFCLGTLISKEWVLASPFCILAVNVSDTVIFLGHQNKNGSNPYETSRTVTEAALYSDILDDIALFHLSSPVDFSDHIRPVCLAAADSSFAAGTEGWLTRWNIDSTEEPFLQGFESSVVDDAECQAEFGSIFPNSICLERVNGGTLPCVGGSGSLIIRQGSQWIQFGVYLDFICIFINATGTHDIHLKVSKYEDWIRNHTSSSPPGFISYPLIPTITDGGSISRLSFSLAFSFSTFPLVILGII